MSTWVDLGDGAAICPARVRSLYLDPPWPPSMLRVRAYLEQLSWTVHVIDDRTSIVHTVGYYWDEAGARAHARTVVDAMLEAA